MKRMVYIAHPLGNYGVFEDNLKEVNDILYELTTNKEYKEKFIFVTPITMYADLYYKVSYQDGMQSCLDVLSKCDELWLFGDWKESKGCMKEYTFAKKHGKTIQTTNKLIAE